MAKAILGYLGTAIAIGVALTCTSVFTNAWVVDAASGAGVKLKIGFGLIPYQSDLPDWFHMICFHMYMALGFSALIILAYIFAFWKAYRHGICFKTRAHFGMVRVNAVIIGYCEMGAFLIAIINAPASVDYPYGSETQYVGYSGYLALVAFLFQCLTIGICIYIIRQCILTN